LKKQIEGVEEEYPHQNTGFYYISIYYDVIYSNFDWSLYKILVDTNNYYQIDKYTEEQVEAIANHLKNRDNIITKYNRYVDKHKEEKIDWKNDKKYKYFPDYTNDTEKIITYGVIRNIFQTTFHYTTSEQICKDAIAHVGEDALIKYVFSEVE
jgi:hypothetical protein